MVHCWCSRVPRHRAPGAVLQNHVLGLNLRASNGLLSPANAEWVHFIWNWGVLLAIVALLVSGRLRNVWVRAAHLDSGPHR
jgi:hypothetical protein